MAIQTVTLPLVPASDDPEIFPGVPLSAGATAVAPVGSTITTSPGTIEYTTWRVDLSGLCSGAAIQTVRVVTDSTVTLPEDPEDGVFLSVYTDVGGPAAAIHSPNYTIAVGNDSAQFGLDIGPFRGSAGNWGATPGPLPITGQLDVTYTTTGATNTSVVGVLVTHDNNASGGITTTVTAVEVTYDDALCPQTPVAQPDTLGSNLPADTVATGDATTNDDLTPCTGTALYRLVAGSETPAGLTATVTPAGAVTLTPPTGYTGSGGATYEVACFPPGETDPNSGNETGLWSQATFTASWVDVPPTPGCSESVTVCNPDALIVEACHQGARVLVEYQRDSTGRILPFNAAAPFHGRVVTLDGALLGRGDQPVGVGNVWPSTLDGVCAAATLCECDPRPAAPGY